MPNWREPLNSTFNTTEAAKKLHKSCAHIKEKISLEMDVTLTWCWRASCKFNGQHQERLFFASVEIYSSEAVAKARHDGYTFWLVVLGYEVAMWLDIMALHMVLI